MSDKFLVGRTCCPQKLHPSVPTKWSQRLKGGSKAGWDKKRKERREGKVTDGGGSTQASCTIARTVGRGNLPVADAVGAARCGGRVLARVEAWQARCAPGPAGMATVEVEASEVVDVVVQQVWAVALGRPWAADAGGRAQEGGAWAQLQRMGSCSIHCFACGQPGASSCQGNLGGGSASWHPSAIGRGV